MLSNRASTFLADLSGTEPDATLSLTSGALAVASPGGLAQRRVLAQPVAPGSYPAFVHMSEQEFDAVPTAGVDGFWLRLGDAPVARWEEAKTADDEPLIDTGDTVGFCVGDAEIFESDGELGDAIQQVFDDDCTTDGVAAVEDKAVVVYVGEVAVEHRCYCGFDAADGLVALVGVFQYPGDDD
jgi:hypothetical protein